MPRIPIVGNDFDDWGNVLNEFLTVSHVASGASGGDLNTGALSDIDFTGTISLSGASSVSLPITTYIGSVTPTEVGYLSGTSSNIQTQIDNKANTTHSHFLVEGASDITATVSEINQAIDNIGVTVTAANLTQLTNGSLTSLHSHSNSVTAFNTYTVDSTGTNGGYTSIIAPDEQTIYIGYTTTDVNRDFKFALSTDSGVTWDIKLVDTTSNGFASMTSPTSGTIYATYYTDSAKLNFAKSIDNGTAWSTVTVDSTGTNVGQYAAIDAADVSNIFISYYDSTNGDLKVATSSTSGALWNTITVDSTGDIGQYTSIKSIFEDFFYISYYDVTNGNLKLAKYDGGIWTISTVDSTGDVGQYTSIDTIGTNNVFISYYDVTNGNLKLAISDDAGATFAISTLDSTGDVGKFTSIKNIDLNNIVISYYDTTNSNLKLARTTDNGTTWSISTIDSTDNVGQYTSVDAIDTSNMFISYYDVTNTNLKFAKSTLEVPQYATLNTANVWTKAQNVLQYDLGTISGSATVDASLSNTFIITASGNISLVNPTNLVSGGVYIWHINQDGIGNRTITFDTLFKFPGGTVPTLSTTASAKDTLTSIYDGTVLRCNLEKDFK